MSNFQEFIENVKAGKVSGLEINNAGSLTKPDVKGVFPLNKDSQMEVDHLCAHIRRWLTGKGYRRPLEDDYLTIYKKEDESEGPRFMFCDGSELDWHIDAANWVIKQGVEG
jgi:hypothetical protein